MGFSRSARELKQKYRSKKSPSHPAGYVSLHTAATLPLPRIPDCGCSDDRTTLRRWDCQIISLSDAEGGHVEVGCPITRVEWSGVGKIHGGTAACSLRCWLRATTNNYYRRTQPLHSSIQTLKNDKKHMVGWLKCLASLDLFQPNSFPYCQHGRLFILFFLRTTEKTKSLAQPLSSCSYHLLSLSFSGPSAVVNRTLTQTQNHI